ncbi:dihydroneopterin aldolase [Egicoccus halophilus]|uniref:7,8-dihydroneopterin aldolase n=1 Tax=Egicoccus halophilus TaxID=1670830 RepID=A0A8J3A9N3_9ACTN|nr:dihydroneopterin aldolase [Egicoccus halophilus]GGI07762.1 7,8-dihydroneopterin aldolase [Egicoccus halophilus]
MDRIVLTGIEAFGHHGVLPHEREFGQRFVVDVVLELDLSTAAASDDLADTVHYGELAGQVADEVAGAPVDLIEALAGRIADRALQPGRVVAVEVTVHKPSAPLPVVAREVAVTLRRERGGAGGAA